MSPRTLAQVRVEDAAKVIAQHAPRLALVCSCGDIWSPEHVANALSRAGCLGWAKPQCQEVATDVLFQCPECFSVAPWTDGVTLEGGGRDEFWCQTCGHESPLEDCRRVAP